MEFVRRGSSVKFVRCVAVDFHPTRMRDYMMVLPNPIVIIEEYLALGHTGKFRSS